HELGAVEVEEAGSELVVARALGPARRSEEPVEEGLPVGQPGEGVVHGQVLQELLGRLALGDVGGRPGQSPGLALLVPYGGAAAQHPDVAAITAEQAVLVVEA